MKTVLIVGAGAMGCLFAARLGETGADVTLVDTDEARIEALNRHGITLQDDTGTRTVPARAARAVELSEPPDLLILFTKSIHGEMAVRSVAHLSGPRTCALTLQNGLGNAEILAAAFAPARVLVGVTTFPSNLDGPTTVSSHGAGQIVLGPLESPGSKSAAEVADLFNRAHLPTDVSPDVQAAVWAKAAFNAALNPLGAITGLTNGGLANAEGRQIAHAVVAETVAVAEASGISLDCLRIIAQVDQALATHGDHRASMLQDIAAGRTTEIEFINGAIARAGERAGVPCPVTASLAGLVRLIEQRHRPAG